MKKPTVNKSTLLLAVLAVAFWCFYFWQEKENQEFLINTQGFISNATNEILQFRQKENYKFIRKATYSLKDKNQDTSDYNNNIRNKIEKKLYNFIPKSLQDYFSLVGSFEKQFILQKYYDKEYVLDEKRLNSLKNYTDSVHKVLGVKKSTIHSINWQQNDTKIWLDLVKQRQQIIDLTDSILRKNKKQFPSSYVSNNFEGYSMLVPDYQKEIMLVKSFIFFTDTKYGTEYYTSKKKYEPRIDIDSLFLDSDFNNKTFYSFQKQGDTVLYPVINKDKSQKSSVSIKVISKKTDYAN
ncbi:hypothetical protein [Bernardetia sp. MNP-M8]|uniref:hypothetical protein n=1 Tax=Bernardetia sp. MNP-M8 TaxID=3127470 RepID=UPI0030D103D9